MPVDFSFVGRPSAVPRRPRFWPWWFCIWFACNAIGVAIAMVLWPKGQPASGAKFWFDFFGISNGIFVVLAGIERLGYEVLWCRATGRNRHRNRELVQRIRTAQRPLQVLGVGCCLPLGGQTLAGAIAAGKRLPALQMPRRGLAPVEHARFVEADWLADEPVSVDSFADDAAMAEREPVKQVPLLTLKIAAALEPLAASLTALTCYERVWWPQVRVLSTPGREEADRAQIADALRIAGLPPLAVQAAPEKDGLMFADAWLDAKEARPLLVVATAWHEDGAPEGSTEGCVAVLLAAGYFRLPETVTIAALLHRPVLGCAGDAAAGFMVAALCGKTDPAAVTRAWITRPVEHCDRALDAAGFQAAAKDAGQFRPDRIVGDTGAANGLLAIAAAIESGAVDGPQFIVDGLQSAVLCVTPQQTIKLPDNR
ncbi:Type VI secretion protein [Paraburkholderia sacchari]|uniref:hypothetical protein n=1 Tax=Paraburkholderia sacchari TaxID=159450 RepID=UPI0039A58BED